MTNIEDVWDTLDPETQERSRKAMAKYGDNKWWRSDDPIKIAMYQIFEPILLTDIVVYNKGLEKLLDRPVHTHDLRLDIDGLREEAILAIKRLKIKGLGVSDEYRETALRRSIEMLEEQCKKRGMELIKFKRPEKPDRNSNGIDISGYDGWIE